MNKYHLSLCCLAAVICSQSNAKELGAIGNTYPIQEQSAISFIYKNLDEMQASGKLDEIKRKAEKNVREHAVRPEPVAGFSKVEKYNKFYIDPTDVAPADVTDDKGNVLAKAGTPINPLEVMAIRGYPYKKIMIFIDGDSKKQVKWVKDKISPLTKIVLINGNVRDVSNQLGVHVYFDQSGVLTKKWGLSKAPSIVQAEKFRLAIEEIDIGETLNE